MMRTPYNLWKPSISAPYILKNDVAVVVKTVSVTKSLKPKYDVIRAPYNL